MSDLVHTSTSGTVTVPEDTLLEIVARAARGIDGVRVRRRRTLSVVDRTARVEIGVRRGEPVQDAAARVQDAVHDALERMCGLAVRVDVDVEELV